MHKLVLKKDNLAQQQTCAPRQLHGRTVQRAPIPGHVRTARIFSRKVYSVTSAPNTALITTARLKLVGSRLPVLEESLHIGECARAALLSKARELLGQAKIPPQLSGHGITKDKHHSHAFYLPEDANNDGIIDHLVVHANYGLCSESQYALTRLEKLRFGGNQQCQVLLEKISRRGAFTAASPLLQQSTTWLSATPYLHPWYAKKKFSVAQQLHRECNERGLPGIENIEHVETIRVAGHVLYPMHFRRFRKKCNLAQPDTRGSFWRITFSQPVTGPLALGFGCHFGLGVFGVEKK